MYAKNKHHRHHPSFDIRVHVNAENGETVFSVCFSISATYFIAACTTVPLLSFPRFHFVCRLKRSEQKLIEWLVKRKHMPVWWQMLGKRLLKSNQQHFPNDVKQFSSYSFSPSSSFMVMMFLFTIDTANTRQLIQNEACFACNTFFFSSLFVLLLILALSDRRFH